MYKLFFNKLDKNKLNFFNEKTLIFFFIQHVIFEYFFYFYFINLTCKYFFIKLYISIYYTFLI
ncbi:MAG: hypothetical protein CMD07_07070 [Flavobacteriales bacterium]|nr:hypothetical protein [Flavobacteriales bacterium]